jgi:4-nitrophenyl phosphatase
LCDLDGVVWLAHVAIPGAPEAIADLRASGRRVLFVTNNSKSTIAEQEAALAQIGVPAVGDVVTSAQAGASLIESGERVLVCGGVGVVEAVTERGGTAVRSADAPDPAGFDAVIVGLHDDFDYAGLQTANAAIRAGARFIATNTDATYPTTAGPIPGAGSILAAVRTVAESEPVVAGKPFAPMARLVAERCGPTFAPDAALMVGDRASTDGRFAATVGCPFALVRTGVAPPGAALDADADIDLDAASLAAVADVLLDR